MQLGQLKGLQRLEKLKEQEEINGPPRKRQIIHMAEGEEREMISCDLLILGATKNMKVTYRSVDQFKNAKGNPVYIYNGVVS
jgi:hypothetical protein